MPRILSNTRFSHLIIICIISVGIAIVCYFMGGLVAEISGVATEHIPAFKAGGSVAAFLIILLILLHAYKWIGGHALTLNVSLTAKPPLRKKGDGMSAQYTVLKQSSAAKREFESQILWLAGSPSIRLDNIEEDDLVMVRVHIDGRKILETDYFSPLSPSVMLKEID